MKVAFSLMRDFIQEKISRLAAIKVFVILCMIASIFWMFRYAVVHHDPADPLVELTIIDAKQQKEFGAFTVKVETGIFIKHFPLFNLDKNNFIADLIVWFEYDADQVMLDTIGKFSFDNGDIIKKSSPDIKIKGNKMVVKYDVRMSFKSDLHYKRFPLEDHRVSLMLTNNFTTPKEMYYFVDNAAFKVAPNTFIPDWIIKDLNAEAGYLKMPLDSRDKKSSSAPKARFTINLAKKGAKKAYVIFVPLFFAMLISMFSFVSGIRNVTQRSIFASTPMPALLGYRFVIEHMLPTVAYFTTTDKIYILLLLVAFFNFVFQVLFIRQANLMIRQSEKDSSAKTEERVSILENINTAVFAVAVLILTLGSALCILV